MKCILATSAILMAMTGAAVAEPYSAKPMMGMAAIDAAVYAPTDFLASGMIGMRIYNVERAA